MVLVFYFQKYPLHISFQIVIIYTVYGFNDLDA
jgi:hypothetical protein